MTTTENIAFKWTEEFDESDYVWAKAYFSEKGIHYGYSLGKLPDLKNSAENREVESKLRGAWRQRKARKELRGKRAYSYVLSDSSKKNLDVIARNTGLSITAALAKVIDSESHRADEQKESKRRLRQIKELEKELAKEAEERLGARGRLNVFAATLDQLAMRLALATVKLEPYPGADASETALKQAAIAKYLMIGAYVRHEISPADLALPRMSEAEAVWFQINNSIWPEFRVYNLGTPNYSDVL